MAAAAHKPTIPANVAATIFSCGRSGPSSASARRAARGASGVAVTSGLMTLYRTSGSRAIAARVGMEDATNQEPNPISRPWARAISAPRGFAAMAVNHRADETVRLAMPENMRKVPRRGWPSCPGRAPAASATESTSG